MDHKSLQCLTISWLCNFYPKIVPLEIHLQSLAVYKALVTSTSFTLQGNEECMLLLPLTHEETILREVNSHSESNNTLSVIPQQCLTPGSSGRRLWAQELDRKAHSGVRRALQVCQQLFICILVVAMEALLLDHRIGSQGRKYL